MNYFKARPNIAQNMTTESEVFLSKHAPSAFLFFEAKTVPFQSRLDNDVREVVY